MARLNQAMQDLMKYNVAISAQKRSSFNKNHSHLTTLDSAYLVPLMYDRVLPGDEKKIRYSGLARMATPIHPTMDEAYLDVWAFFVPDRLWWSHAKEFYGENLDASFNPDGEYRMPSVGHDMYYVRPTDRKVGLHSLCDYFGLPVERAQFQVDDYDSTRINVGLFRSYQIVYNEYYRNTSIQPALHLSTGDHVTPEEWDVISTIRKVNKLPDMFTTLLREPQAGDDVVLPIANSAPVVPVSGVDNRDATQWDFAPAIWKSVSGFNPLTNRAAYFAVNGGGDTTSGAKLAYDNNVFEGDVQPVNTLSPVNLMADLSSASATTINDLRAAITVQQLLELDAIGGKRYQNILQAHFGVFTPDATLQRPELLGVTRTPIGMRQVLQTSSTDATSPQGNTAAVSVTNVANEWICNKAFTEPGYIIVLGAIRPIHSYSQGVDPLLRKLDRYDHYWPVFENLGNQPVMLSDLYASIDDRESQDNLNPFTKVFGYKEAWQEYRFKANRVSGLMRPDVDGSLASWNYTTYLDTAPLLDSAFISEDPALIDRTIAVPSEPQFILDSYFEYTDIKNMGVHSIPGLTRL